MFVIYFQRISRYIQHTKNALKRDFQLTCICNLVFFFIYKQINDVILFLKFMVMIEKKGLRSKFMITL